MGCGLLADVPYGSYNYSMSPAPVLPLILLVSDDLLFPSRIREALRDLPYRLKTTGSESGLVAAIEAESPAAIVVNLTARRYDPLALISRCKADPATRVIPLLAFAGHVESEKQAAARAAGADKVAANSSVSLHFPALLTRLLSPTISDDDLEDAADPADAQEHAYVGA